MKQTTGTCLGTLVACLLAGCRHDTPPAPPTAPAQSSPTGQLTRYDGALHLHPVGNADGPPSSISSVHLEPVLQRVLHLTAVPSAEPRYGHADDYRWLIGELSYSYVRDAWCLRYASADDADEHGGSVTLVGSDLNATCHARQLVRVQGHLLDPASREPEPAYEVRSIKPLQ